jgi:hypothetical protein
LTDGAHHVALGHDDDITGYQIAFVAQQVNGIVAAATPSLVLSK